MIKGTPGKLTRSQISMAEALPHMVWTATPEGVVDFINEEFVRYTGLEGLLYAQGEWLLAVHPDDRDGTIAHWVDCVRKGIMYKTEFRIKHRASGHYRWHFVSAQPYKSAAGRILRWFGSTVDIHSSKISDFVIQDSQARLKRHIDLQVLENKVLDSISAGESLHRVHELIISTVEYLLPDVRCFIKPASDAIRIGDFLPELPVEFSKSVPVMDSSGNLLAIFGLIYDAQMVPSEDDLLLIERISQFLRVAIERTNQHLELKRNEERFRLVAKVTSDVVWECDLRTDEVWYSDGMKLLFGHDPVTDPALKRASTAGKYIHPDDFTNVVSAMQDSIRSGQESWQLEYRYRRLDGSYAQVVNHAYVVRDLNDVPVRLIGSVKDISNQVNLEEQLRASQRLKAVGQMTGGLAHDFNNLLTVILGNVERLSDALPDEDPLQAHVQTIINASLHGAELTNSLLAFARKQSLKPQSVNVLDLISSMRSLLSSTLGEQIELSIFNSDDLWMAHVDPIQFKSAVINLCLNARDAMLHGGCLEIDVCNIVVQERLDMSSESLAPGMYVRMSVRDYGAGMSPDVLERVFEPFFTTKEVGKGSGLGLSMVYGFIKQSNGHIQIESTAGKGTCVSIYLPKATISENVNMQTSGVKIANGDGEHILLVEDDEMVRQHVESLLISLGYRVTAVMNAAECLKVIAKLDRVDLLFSDIVMPGGMSGTQLAAIVRERYPEMPILLTSGYAEDVFSGLGASDELMCLLKKPYRRSDLAAMLQKVLNK